jgi:hypothetical protein
MAYRIQDHVLFGELYNTRRYSTHGRIAIRGWEMPLMVELTGDCGPDLQGKAFRFEARPLPDDELAALEPLKGFQPHQIGPTGTMTAERWVKDFACPISEYLNRAKTGEPPPTEWKRLLYLEWYSQNGRVVIELLDPALEYLDGEEWKPLPMATPKPDDDAPRPPESGLSISIVHADGLVERLQSRPPDEEREEADAAGEAAASDAQSLQRQLDRQAARVDRALRGGTPPPDGEDGGDDDVIAEMELMDHLIENETGEPLVSLFDTPRRLPPADTLTEEQAETVFKSLLIELALCGIAFHVCEHLTPREAYRMLIERVIPEGRAFKELRGTGWVQNYSAYDYCPECEAEADRDYEENHEKYEQAGRERAEEQRDNPPPPCDPGDETDDDPSS